MLSDTLQSTLKAPKDHQYKLLLKHPRTKLLIYREIQVCFSNSNPNLALPRSARNFETGLVTVDTLDSPSEPEGAPALYLLLSFMYLFVQIYTGR